MAQRELYIDRLRTAMTALVILHHTAITYGGSGGWFYREVETSAHPSSLLLTLFCATNQSYFMGIFFLLAGYFTPASLQRKGFARFMGDRFLRLGLPLLGFALLLGPLTVAMVNSAQGGGFWPCIATLWRERAFLYGPLWFAQALLIFSLGYGAWRAMFGPPPMVTLRPSNPWSSLGWWLLNIPGLALIIFSIRLLVPLRVIFGPSIVALKTAFHARGLLPKFVLLWRERERSSPDRCGLPPLCCFSFCTFFPGVAFAACARMIHLNPGSVCPCCPLGRHGFAARWSWARRPSLSSPRISFCSSWASKPNPATGLRN
jgi:hypothetical protein